MNQQLTSREDYEKYVEEAVKMYKRDLLQIEPVFRRGNDDTIATVKIGSNVISYDFYRLMIEANK